MRSRAFLLGVTAAHGSLEPLVLVRIQEEELGGSTSNRFSLYTRFDVCCTGHTGSGVTQAAKRRHALVAQWIERPPPERKATSPILVEGTRSRKLFRCLSSASCSTCVGSLTAEYRSPKPVGVRSRLTRRARTVSFGSLLLTDSSSRMIPSHPVPIVV